MINQIFAATEAWLCLKLNEEVLQDNLFNWEKAENILLYDVDQIKKWFNFVQ